MALLRTTQLLSDLQDGLNAVSARVQALAKLPPEVLARPTATGGWSALQAVAHLNFYSEVYESRLDAALRAAVASGQRPSDTYTTGWLGDYFVTLMAPRPDGSVGKKMKAPAASAPSPDAEGGAVLATFERLQRRLYAHAATAGTVRPDRIRVATMLPMVRLRLGDALRFLLAHQQRHLAQAERAAAAAQQG